MLHRLKRRVVQRQALAAVLHQHVFAAAHRAGFLKLVAGQRARQLALGEVPHVHVVDVVLVAAAEEARTVVAVLVVGGGHHHRADPLVRIDLEGRVFHGDQLAAVAVHQPVGLEPVFVDDLIIPVPGVVHRAKSLLAELLALHRHQAVAAFVVGVLQAPRLRRVQPVDALCLEQRTLRLRQRRPAQAQRQRQYPCRDPLHAIILPFRFLVHLSFYQRPIKKSISVIDLSIIAD